MSSFVVLKLSNLIKHKATNKKHLSQSALTIYNGKRLGYSLMLPYILGIQLMAGSLQNCYFQRSVFKQTFFSRQATKFNK